MTSSEVGKSGKLYTSGKETTTVQTDADDNKLKTTLSSQEITDATIDMDIGLKESDSEPNDHDRNGRANVFSRERPGPSTQQLDRASRPSQELQVGF
jgi:hypothetical protein